MLNRLNVLLTRCRKAIILVTNKNFIKLGGARTLLGDMVAHWEHVLKSQHTWVDWRLVAVGAANLPGALGPNCRQHLAARSLPPLVRHLEASPISGLARKTQHMTAWTALFRDAGNPWRVAQPGTGDTKCTTSQSPPAIESDWPPLAASKMPILKGSWNKLASPPNAPHKYSLLRSTPRALTTTKEPPPLTKEPMPVTQPPQMELSRGSKHILSIYGMTSSNIYCRRR